MRKMVITYVRRKGDGEILIEIVVLSLLFFWKILFAVFLTDAYYEHTMNQEDLSEVQKLRNRKRQFYVFKTAHVFRKNKSLKQTDRGGHCEILKHVKGRSRRKMQMKQT